MASMGSVGHEHLATEAARTWLGKIVAYAPEPQRLAPVVLACGPRDTHTLGLEALGALLVHSGRPCWVLGARTPVTALVSTIGRVEPAAVVVVSHLSIGRRLAAQAVHNAAMRGVPTFYAGNAFISASTRHRMRGQYLGDSLRDAARVVERVSVQ
jgi:MerR family transcriptional regulator, light-induced transcriptional regulator